MINAIGLNIFGISSIGSYIPKIPKASKLAMLFLSMPFSVLKAASKENLSTRDIVQMQSLDTPQVSSFPNSFSRLDHETCLTTKPSEEALLLQEKIETLEDELADSKRLAETYENRGNRLVEVIDDYADRHKDLTKKFKEETAVLRKDLKHFKQLTKKAELEKNRTMTSFYLINDLYTNLKEHASENLTHTKELSRKFKYLLIGSLGIFLTVLYDKNKKINELEKSLFKSNQTCIKAYEAFERASKAVYEAKQVISDLQVKEKLLLDTALSQNNEISKLELENQRLREALALSRSGNQVQCSSRRRN